MRKKHGEEGVQVIVSVSRKEKEEKKTESPGFSLSLEDQTGLQNGIRTFLNQVESDGVTVKTKLIVLEGNERQKGEILKRWEE